MELFADASKIIPLIMYVAVALAAVAYFISTWINSKGKADSDTIVTYKGELEVLQSKVLRLEDDSKDHIREIGVLQGENKTLKEVLALRDPKFEDSFLKLANAIKDMRDDLRKHYQEDDKNFKLIFNKIQ